MPVILPKKAAWLDPDTTPAELQDLLVPWAGKMTATVAPKPKAETGESATKSSREKTTKGK
jgi:hypothetical protein